MNINDIPDRYEFTGEKFSGGQGDIYVCKDKNLERKVAIKFMQDISEMDRLLAEILALQSMRSKHVVEIYDLIRTDSEKEIGLVEEFIDGPDLDSFLVENDSPNLPDVDNYLNTIYQIACGIFDIHDVGIVHRDIKLNNMKSNDKGLVKIFDFGLAKIIEIDASTKGFKGTQGYAAPELYADDDDTVAIGKPVDIYAFGVAAWILATGGLTNELDQTPPTTAPPELYSIRTDIPKEICALIDNCLNIEYKKRPNIEEIVDLLSSRLTHGKHRGLLTSSGKKYEINEIGKGINIDLGEKGSATIVYDGHVFLLKPKSGIIVINNNVIEKEIVLPGASVIAFGDPDQPKKRYFFTFDISHPEVVL